MKKMLSFISAAVLSSCAVANSLFSASAVNFTLTANNPAQAPVAVNTDPNDQLTLTVNRCAIQNVGFRTSVVSNLSGGDTVTVTANWINPNNANTEETIHCAMEAVLILNGVDLPAAQLPPSEVTLSSASPGPKSFSTELGYQVRSLRWIASPWPENAAHPDPASLDCTVSRT
ncbi:MAG: hypothetical protein LBJ95_00305 [Oscillospiraceae bacterium]|nr:hypothetical protein [Oscillospiraceae bacterium]